ncbi:helix-turn-helix transcriptional regulator [Curtobacterium sp. ME26]|uniref:helix-turn-helix transcriptional regulator n=1 Tax=Curtobacterium sp. ME26 TaxID=2744254 RepID=UPI00398761B6
MWRDVRLRHTILDIAAVDDVLAGWGLLPVRLLRLRSAPRQAALQRWKAVSRHAQAYAGSATFIDAPLSRNAVFGLLTAAFVEAFADRSQSPVDAPVHPAGGRRAVKVAVEYTREHAAEDLPIPTVAAAAGVSVRALQRAFAAKLGQRPLDVIRTERLRRAREDLRHSHSGAPTTVRVVAARWGFTNAGRFAAAYAAQHGHPPAEDLRRG